MALHAPFLSDTLWPPDILPVVGSSAAASRVGPQRVLCAVDSVIRKPKKGDARYATTVSYMRILATEAIRPDGSCTRHIEIVVKQGAWATQEGGPHSGVKVAVRQWVRSYSRKERIRYTGGQTYQGRTGRYYSAKIGPISLGNRALQDRKGNFLLAWIMP